MKKVHDIYIKVYGILKSFKMYKFIPKKNILDFIETIFYSYVKNHCKIYTFTLYRLRFFFF